MEARMRHWTRPVHWLTLDRCFKPVLTFGTFHHLHTFKVHPPTFLYLCPIILVSCYSIWADSRKAFMWRGRFFIHRQPCQFPLPWQIFNTKASYTFNMKTQVVWWTVKCKINCCCQKEIPLNIIWREVVFILKVCLLKFLKSKLWGDSGWIESSKKWKNHVAKCSTNKPDKNENGGKHSVPLLYFTCNLLLFYPLWLYLPVTSASGNMPFQLRQLIRMSGKCREVNFINWRGVEQVCVACLKVKSCGLLLLRYLSINFQF